MSREREGFRENVQMLNERFPDVDMLTVKDVMQITGLCEQTVRKYIRFNPATKRVTKADLARQIGV